MAQRGSSDSIVGFFHWEMHIVSAPFGLSVHNTAITWGTSALKRLKSGKNKNEPTIIHKESRLGLNGVFRTTKPPQECECCKRTCIQSFEVDFARAQ